MADWKDMTEGQRAYEARRAAKAGQSLDAWLAGKRRAEQEAVRSGEAAEKKRAPGFFSKLLDRAHAPLKK